MMNYVYSSGFASWMILMGQLKRHVRIEGFIVRSYMRLGYVVSLRAYLTVYDFGINEKYFEDKSYSHTLIYCSNALKHVYH